MQLWELVKQPLQDYYFSIEFWIWSPQNRQDAHKWGRAKSNGNPPAWAGTHKDGQEAASVLAISNHNEVSPVYMLMPFVTKLNAHLAQELEKLREDLG